MKKTMFQPLVVLATVAVLGLTVFAARPSAQGTVALEAGPTPMEANCASRLDGCLFRLDGHKFLDMDGDGGVGPAGGARAGGVEDPAGRRAGDDDG